MDYFDYIDGSLHCDSVSIARIAGEIGTPFYVYSSRTIHRHIERIDGAFNGIHHLTCYSVKANGNLAILQMMADSGMGADIVSGGELYRARLAGIPPDRIVFSGVGKTEKEIQYALREGILAFNVESLPELDAIDCIAGNMGVKAPVSLRINPDVDPKTHPYISTGLKGNKFGVPHAWAMESFRTAAGKANIDVVGIDAHIGSQITTVEPFVASAERLRDMIRDIRSAGIPLSLVDIGGGLGIRYENETPPEPWEWATAILPILRETGCRVLFEPGRSMIGNAGVLVTRVLYTKRNEDKMFIIVDAGMNDLARPMLYGSYHEIRSVTLAGFGNEGNDAERPAAGDPGSSGGSRHRIVADVVGPICESGDFFAKDREIEPVESGDLLAIMSAGAYGFSMSSNYNSRPRVAEVLVTGVGYEIVRERETFEDLVRGERLLVRRSVIDMEKKGGLIDD